MKSRLLVCWLAGCLWLIVLTGCGSNIQIVHCRPSWPDEVVKIKASEMSAKYASRNGARTREVGTVVTVSQYIERDGVSQDSLYKTVSDNIISLLEKVGVTSWLVSNQDDPKLENVDYILHVNYREIIKYPGGGGGGVSNAPLHATMVATMISPVMIATLPLALAIMNTPSTGIPKGKGREAYDVTIYDLKTDKSFESQYDTVHEVIQNVKTSIGIWEDAHKQHE